jgi:hypothetical protein
MPSDKESPRFQPASLALVLDQIIREITTCYQAPNTIVTPDDAKLWAASFGQALTDETRDPAELLDAWREFRRGFTRGFWPIPGAVCQAIRDLRANRRAYEPPAKPAFDALPPPPRGKRWSDLTDDEKADHDERMRRIKAELAETTAAVTRPPATLMPKHLRDGPGCAAREEAREES